jgi:hypothetical protein
MQPVSLVETPPFSRLEFDQLQTEIFFIENVRLIAAFWPAPGLDDTRLS